MTIAVAPADMLVYIAVVREGGFTRAARHLGLTKQTVSERVARLEENLGVRLLERTTRRLRTTDAGLAYYDRCAAIALLIDEANSEVQRRVEEPVGLLRVSSPVLYGRRFLAPVVADYLARYARARVEIALSDRRVDLIEEGFDLAIRVGKLDDSSLTARRIGQGHMYYVASPGFLAAHGAPTARTLRSFRCVGVKPFETWRVGGVVTKVEPVLVVNDLEAACDAAAAGVGVARLPGLACREAVRSGALRVLFDADADTVRPVFAVYPSRLHLPAKVRVFVAALEALVEPMKPIEPIGRAERDGRARRGAPRAKFPGSAGAKQHRR